MIKKQSNMINEKNQKNMKLENNFNFTNHYKKKIAIERT
jgi:hypothetical protein